MTEYTRLLFFLPENGNNNHSDWWFKADQLYLEEIALDSLPSQDQDIIQLCNEWNVLLGGGFETADIHEVVFGEDTIVDGKIILSPSAPLSAQKVLAAFSKKPDLYRYLIEAKQLENVMIGSYNDWYDVSEQEIRKSYEAYKQQGSELVTLTNQVKNNKALYEKYLFQIIKLYAAGFDHKQLNTYFKEFRKEPVSNTLQGWGILYYLTVTTTDTIQDNILLAEAMRLSPGKLKRCVELFVPMKDTRYIYQVADPELRANLLSMQALYDFRPNAYYIEDIARLDPNNPLLVDLIGREINKYEDYRFTNAYTGHDILGQWTSKQKHEQSFKELTSTLTYLYQEKKNNHRSQSFFCLALAHCKALGGQQQEAYSLLAKVNTNYLPHKIQQGITRLYLLTDKNLSEEKVQDEIAAQIMSIASLSKNNVNTNRCISGILLKMHQALLAKNQVALSGLCLLNSNMIQLTNNYFSDYTWYELNATHEQCRALEQLVQKENKRPFEKLLTRGLSLPLIHDFRARMYIREQNLDSALVQLHKLPEFFFIQQYNYLILTSYFFKEENVPNNSLTVIEALTLLNKKIKTVDAIVDNKEKARQYLAIANAFFELSNKGNYCYATGYYSSNYPVRSAKEIQAKYPDAFFSFYIKAQPAFHYFKKAHELSKDVETSAAIQYHYMKAYDEIYESTQSKRDEELPKDGWIYYFKTYSNTSFYQKHSCPGIEWYLEKAS